MPIGCTSWGLPKTPRTIKRIAEFAAVMLEKGEEVDFKSLAAMVKDDYLSEIKDLLGPCSTSQAASEVRQNERS